MEAELSLMHPAVHEEQPFSDSTYMGNGVVMGKALAAIDRPAEMVYLQELDWHTRIAWLRPDCSAIKTCTAWQWFDAVRNKFGYNDNHQEGGNLVHADGHARFRRYDALRS